MTPPTPSSLASSSSRSISSTESWKTPGIEPTGLRIFEPERTNSGSTSCDGASRVSWMSRRERLGAAEPARTVFGKRRHSLMVD